MATTVATDRVRDGAVAPAAEAGGLKTGAIGFVSNVAIGVSSIGDRLLFVAEDHRAKEHAA